MKKQYETPVVSSLRYVLAEGIAAPNGPCLLYTSDAADEL